MALTLPTSVRAAFPSIRSQGARFLEIRRFLRVIGDLTGGTVPDMVFASQFQTLGPVPGIPVANRIDLTATNISALTINWKRAHVDCKVDLHITSDGPITVTLAGCNRTASH